MDFYEIRVMGWVLAAQKGAMCAGFYLGDYGIREGGGFWPQKGGGKEEG